MLGQAHSTEEVSTVSAHCLLQVLLADGADALFPAVLPQGDHGLHPTLPVSCLIGPPSPLAHIDSSERMAQLEGGSPTAA